MFSLSDVYAAAGQPRPPEAPDLAISAAHFDSRRIEPGMLFVALPGERVDGNDYLGDALGRGAAATLGSRIDEAHPSWRQVTAPDALVAFQQLARGIRRHGTATVVGVMPGFRHFGRNLTAFSPSRTLPFVPPAVARASIHRASRGQANREDSMIRVSVLYPNNEDAKFDLDYYINNHIPMASEALKPYGLGSVEVDKGISAPDPNAPPQYVVMAYLTFDTVENVHEGFKATGRQVMGDIPNFTDIKPEIQISEIQG